MTEDAFTILTVCTGNICRSPAAERLLLRALGSSDTLIVRSAGTGTVAGAAVDPQIERLLQSDGVSASDHRSQYLTDQLVGGSDLILAMTKAHRSAAVALAPAAVRRSFTLSGFAAIASAIPTDVLNEASATDSVEGRLRAIIALSPKYRPIRLDEDIDDPIGQDAATYERVVDEIQAAVQKIALAVVRSA